VPRSLFRGARTDARAHNTSDRSSFARRGRSPLALPCLPVTRRAGDEPRFSAVGSPAPQFPASKPELHDPLRRVVKRCTCEETRVKDSRTCRQFPSSSASSASASPTRAGESHGDDLRRCAGWPRSPSNAPPRRDALSEGSGHLRPFRNPRVVGGWLLRARLDQLSFTPPSRMMGIASERSAFFFRLRERLALTRQALRDGSGNACPGIPKTPVIHRTPQRP
jgi:hypothetical protein